MTCFRQVVLLIDIESSSYYGSKIQYEIVWWQTTQLPCFKFQKRRSINESLVFVLWLIATLPKEMEKQSQMPKVYQFFYFFIFANL